VATLQHLFARLHPTNEGVEGWPWVWMGLLVAMFASMQNYENKTEVIVQVNATIFYR